MNRAPAAVVMLVCVAAISCATSAPPPEIQQQSEHRIWYTGPELRAELEFRWAARHPGEEWLVVRLAAAGAGSAVSPIAREAVTVRTPDGRRLALPDQTSFRAAAGSLRIALESYDAFEPFSHRFDRSLRPSSEWFFSPAGAASDRDTIYPSRQQFCAGPLVFQVPGGVQPGPWTLVIEMRESTVRIPFTVAPTVATE